MDGYTEQTLQTIIAGAKAHLSQMLVGNPGYGKSALVKNLADNYWHYKMITIIGSQKEPTDVTGFPALVQKPLLSGDIMTVTNYAVPSWQFEIMQERKIVLFLDEFSNSTPAVQAAMLQILNEREFPDGSKVPDETIIIGAMNPVETAADGYELGLPVANRLKFIPWEPSFESWSAGLLNNWGNPYGNEGDSVTKGEMYWRKKVVGFLENNRSLFYKLPDKTSVANAASIYEFGDSPAQADIYKSAYPSPRSWTNLARVLQYCILKDKTKQAELMETTANGIVGYEASRAFMSYLEDDSSLPPTEEIIRRPNNIEWATLNPNQSMKIIKESMGMARSHQNYIKPVAHMFIYLAQINQTRYTMAHFSELQTLVATLHDRTLSTQLLNAYKNIGRAAR